MIFKYEIVEAVNSLGLDLAELTSRVAHLEEMCSELEKKCKKACPKKVEKKAKKTAKRGPGRPRKASK